MFLSGPRTVRSVVVGDGAVEAALSGWTGGAGHRVDGEVAVEAESVGPERVPARARERATDCVVVDATQPGVDGPSVVETCASERPDLPVVLVVAGGDERQVADGLAAGATETLPRGLVEHDRETFARELVSTVERERAHSGAADLFDGLAQAVLVYDPETAAVVDANGRAGHLLGYSPEELVGMGAGDLTAGVGEYGGRRARTVVRSARSGDDPLDIEWPFETADGEVRWTRSRLDTASVGCREVVVWSASDVTEYRERARTYEQVFDAVNDVISVHDPWAERLVDVNETLCELTGYERETLCELDVGGLSADDGDRAREIYETQRRVAATGEPETIEWVVETADRATRRLEVNLAPATIAGDDRVLALARDVTERHEYERRLERERDRRSVLFENNPDPVLRVQYEDGEPVIREVNAAFEEVFGFAAETVVGSTVAEVVVPEDQREEHDRLKARVARGETVEQQAPRRTADGIREFLFRVIQVDSADGTDAYVWYTDVTERRELERTYRSVFENVSDGLVVHDPETGEIRDVNDRFCEMNGYDRAELLGESIDVVTAPDHDLDDAQDRIATARETGSELFEWRNQRADGETFPVEVHLSFVEIRGQQRVLASVRDVTERKRREREYEQIFDGVTDAITVHDPETGDILDCNERMCELTGYDRAQLLSAGQEAINVPAEGYSSERARRIVREVMDAEESRTLEWLIERADGEYRWLEVNATPATLSGERRYLAIMRDVTDERRTERRLRAILDRIDEAIFMTRAEEITEPSQEPDYLSAGYEEIWGQPLEELRDRYEEGFFGTLHPDDEADYRAFVEGIVADVRAGEAADSYSREYRIERPDGAVRWVRSDYYPVEWASGPPRVVIVSRDVTDRKSRERRIASFDEATDDLATADTPEEAARSAVDAATDALGLPAVGVFLYDDGDGVLRPEVRTDALQGVAATAIGPEDGPLWRAFASGGVVTAGEIDGETARGAAGPAMLADLAGWRAVALGNHGLLLVGSPDSGLDAGTVQESHVLAATLEAALNHLRGQQRLAAQEAQLRTQTERAERLDRIARLTQRVESAITEASDPGEVERAVCERLAGSGPYALAWVGGVDVGADRITARAIVGAARGHVDAMDLSTTEGAGDTHPAVAAWGTGEVSVASSLVGDGPTGEWRQRALTEGYQSVCAVPLSYDGVTHGVLTVAARAPDAFGDRERDVLEQLGTSIGYALAATERRRALESDETVELEFTGTGADLALSRAARAADCRVRHERTVARQDGTVSVYVGFEGEREDVERVAERTLPGDVDVVSDDGAGTVVETRTDDWFGSPLAEYGAVLREASATPEQTTVTVEVPSGADVRSFVDRLADIAPSLELVAKRQHQRQERTPGELRGEVESELTDRQLEVVRTALSAGYFEWPRESDGGEVADRLGITQPTLNKHLRLAERKTFELLFDADP